MQFAEANWPQDLVLDDWKSYLMVYIQDPTDLNQSRYPRTKAVAYCALKRELNDITNDHSAPQSELWNQAIAQVTFSRIEGDELKGHRGGYTEFNCAYCGSGLGLNGCPNCGHTFRDDASRCGWSTPLPPIIVAKLIQSGHVFGMDPNVAQQNERNNWQRYAGSRKK